MHHHRQAHGCGPGWQSAGRRGSFGAFGRGFGPFGPNFGRGGGPFSIGRVLAGGDLRLIVLALLEESPRHGYEIIKELEEKSSGFYSPSPGVVYPTLTFLEEAGYTTAATEGNKKVYSITDAGRAHLAENREAVDSVLSGIEKFGKKFAAARDWFDWSSHRGERGERPADQDIPDVIPEINEARQTLKAAIAEKLDASEEEQRRVASILREAAAAIRGGGGSEKPDVDL